MSDLLQIALDKDGNLKSIYEVKTGIECDCFCPECKSPLVAKNKNKTSDEALLDGQKIAHFAHFDGSVCLHAPETAIHLLAKKVLSQSLKLFVPNLYREKLKLISGRFIEFDKVEIEKTVKIGTLTIKPDIIITKKSKELYVEFYKTHNVDKKKTEKIKAIKVSCIEIDLNCVEPLVNGKLNIEELKNIFEKNSSYKTWIYNTKEDELYKKAKEKLLKEEQEKDLKDKLEEEARNFEMIAKIEAIKKQQLAELKTGLLSIGFELLEVFEDEQRENVSYFNESNILLKTVNKFKSKDDYVNCPKQKENGNNKSIKLVECEFCEYHKKVIYVEDFNKQIACGFKNNLKR